MSFLSKLTRPVCEIHPIPRIAPINIRDAKLCHLTSHKAEIEMEIAAINKRIASEAAKIFRQ